MHLHADAKPPFPADTNLVEPDFMRTCHTFNVIVTVHVTADIAHFRWTRWTDGARSDVKLAEPPKYSRAAALVSCPLFGLDDELSPPLQPQ